MQSILKDSKVNIQEFVQGCIQGGALSAWAPPPVFTHYFLTLSAMLYLISSYIAHVFFGVLLKK